MRGHQINFYLTPEDMEECENRWSAKNPFVAFEYRSTQPKPLLLKSSKIEAPGVEWLTIGLTHPNYLAAVQFDFIPERGYHTFDEVSSPLIELSRCFYDGFLLRRGRLYYVSKFYGPTDELMQKDAAFLDWAKSIFKATVKGMRRDANLQAYLGPRAAQLHAAQKCVLVI